MSTLARFLAHFLRICGKQKKLKCRKTQNKTIMSSGTPHQLFSSAGVSGINIKNWRISATKKEILNSEELDEYV
jgi:hypothetical protein